MSKSMSRLLLVALVAVLAVVPVRAQSKTIRANGIWLAYQSLGAETDETVLLIAGTGMQLTQWPDELCRALVKRGYRVVRFDNRDVGLSTKFEDAGLPDWAAIGEALKQGKSPKLAYTLNDMARDAVSLMDALKIKRAHLVGVSMGGMIAQIVATDYPERALSLTSIMAQAGNPARPMPAKPAVMGKVPPPAPSANRAAVIAHQMLVWRALGSPRYPTDEKTLRRWMNAATKRSHYPDGVARQGAAALLAGDRRQQLKSIRVPTVVVHGADDPLVAVESGRDVANSIPGAQLRIIPGMGHDLPPQLVPTFVDAIISAASRAKSRN